MSDSKPLAPDAKPAPFTVTFWESGIEGVLLRKLQPEQRYALIKRRSKLEDPANNEEHVAHTVQIALVRGDDRRFLVYHGLKGQRQVMMRPELMALYSKVLEQNDIDP